MPIIEPLPEPNTPLSQGDILKGVCVFSTKNSWNNSGGEAERTNDAFCLVLSRPCAAANNDRIVVAAIEKYKNKPPAEFQSYDEAKQFFIEIRDGLTTPDHFYLGQIPGHEGTFCAHFGSLHTIKIPKRATSERQVFLAAARVARLNQEFAHDLHLRIFRAFASLGFDDHGWFSTEDLRAFVAIADRDEAKIKLRLSEAEATLHLGQSQGFHHDSEKKKAEGVYAKCQKELNELIAYIAPYREELARRHQQGGSIISDVN